MAGVLRGGRAEERAQGRHLCSPECAITTNATAKYGLADLVAYKAGLSSVAALLKMEDGKRNKKGQRVSVLRKKFPFDFGSSNADAASSASAASGGFKEGILERRWSQEHPFTTPAIGFFRPVHLFTTPRI